MKKSRKKLFYEWLLWGICLFVFFIRNNNIFITALSDGILKYNYLFKHEIQDYRILMVLWGNINPCLFINIFNAHRNIGVVWRKTYYNSKLTLCLDCVCCTCSCSTQWWMRDRLRRPSYNSLESYVTMASTIPPSSSTQRWRSGSHLMMPLSERYWITSAQHPTTSLSTIEALYGYICSFPFWSFRVCANSFHFWEYRWKKSPILWDALHWLSPNDLISLTNLITLIIIK